MRVLALVLLATAACGSSGPLVEWEATETAAWRTSQQPALVAARAAFDAGNAVDARAALAEVLIADPDLLTARFLLQELSLTAPGADPVALAATARKQASIPGAAPVEFLLAARLEPDAEAARLLLQGALAGNPEPDFEAACRYGLAYLAFGRGDVVTARRELAASLTSDPGGLRARRLEARLEADRGDAARAERQLTHWLDLSEPAPEISGDVWFAALAELAALRVGLEDRSGARKALERLELPRFGGAYPEAPAGARASGLLFVPSAIRSV